MVQTRLLTFKNGFRGLDCMEIDMKTYGQISNEAFMRHFFKEEVSQEELDKMWRLLPAKEPHEASAQAVIEEFKRRHSIVITPEED